METKAAIDALASLAHETRLRAFRLLVRMGPKGLPAGALAEALDVPNATLSFHLTHLTRAGLLESRRESRSIIYSVRFEGVRALMAYLMEDCCQGRADLCGPAGTECAPAEPAERKA